MGSSGCCCLHAYTLLYYCFSTALVLLVDYCFTTRHALFELREIHAADFFLKVLFFLPAMRSSSSGKSMQLS